MYGFACSIKPAGGELLHISCGLSGDGPAIVAGQVTEQDRSPCEGVLALLLKPETNQVLQFTVTDENGRFYLGPVPPEQVYTLRLLKASQTIRTADISL